MNTAWLGRQVAAGRVEIGGPNDCWHWKGSTDRNGYGRTRFGLAHRPVYLALVGPIPAGMTLDHLCHTADPSCLAGDHCPHRRCVNPRHLEPVSSTENKRRGQSPHGVNFKKLACAWGHVFDEANTRVSQRMMDGASGPQVRVRRACRRCDVRRQQEYQRRKLARLSGTEHAA